jgi:hypothetical protein
MLKGVIGQCLMKIYSINIMTTTSHRIDELGNFDPSRA